MDAGDIPVLLLAGFAASVVNALAGGGSLITFPTLVAVGLPPVAANVTNSLGVSPGYLGSVAGSRRDLADIARRRGAGPLLRLLPTAVVGTVAGCVLLLRTPERAFEVVVPFLVLGATAALAFQQRLRAMAANPNSPDRPVALHAVVGLACVYGGYFGAALGVMLVAALGLVLDESLRHVTALKNAVSAVSGLTTVVAFALFGPVDWAAVAVLVPATLAGGYAGARLVTRLPATVLRALIVAIGTVVGALLLIRALMS
jgi:uncharacterized membrane protein YfcA